jgi:hypothetical protein
MNNLTWIGNFTDFQTTLQILELDKKEGYILDYKIIERDDGNGYDVYTEWNNNRTMTFPKTKADAKVNHDLST